MRPDDIAIWKIHKNDWLKVRRESRHDLVMLVAKRTADAVTGSLGPRVALASALATIAQAPTLSPDLLPGVLAEARTMVRGAGPDIAANTILRIDGRDIEVAQPALLAELIAGDAMGYALEAELNLDRDHFGFVFAHAAQRGCLIAYWLTFAETADDDSAMAAGLAERAVQLAALDKACASIG